MKDRIRSGWLQFTVDCAAYFCLGYVVTKIVMALV